MRLAAVDIGSNTVHVLVADVVRNKLVDVAHYVEMPELGPRVARTGSIGTKSRIAIRELRFVIAQARKHGYDMLIAAATEAVRQASPGDELDDHVRHAVVLAEVVDVDDVRVAHLGDRLRLMAEPSRRVRVGREPLQHLDRAGALQLHVVRAVNEAHRSLADEVLDLVLP